MVPPPIAARSNASAVAAPDAPFATGSAHFWGLVILLSAHLLAFSRYLGRFHGAGGAIARVVVAASLAYLFLGFVASASGYWFLANLAALLALAIFGRSRKDEEDEEEEERKEPSNVRPGLTTRAGIDRPEEREKDERHDPSRRA